ncbi:CtsR family transcriptional regulator [Inediibacterium massiliense]|uniref:CtsR family transcriptional regulator n=1 Tax=Inediibacterium massiliense TaxID=1658111 RepID=UPI000A46B103|nr:CtsR family transcriptional regulator [Inediibacterium massiliense]
MARISDLIEIFIKELLEEANNRSIEIQRNELASYFNCAPSQINYVLTTRFTIDKGYLIESRRGGGGHIKIAQTNIDKNQYINVLLREIGHGMSSMKAEAIIDFLTDKKIITEREKSIMKSAISDRSISTPMNIKDEIRANLLKSMIVAVFNFKGRD